MKSLKDYLEFIKENREELAIASHGYGYDESSLVCGEGLSVYPIQEMAYNRGDWSNKVENLTYQIAENTILICGAFEQDREEQFKYWCKEIFNKFIIQDIVSPPEYLEKERLVAPLFFFAIPAINLIFITLGLINAVYVGLHFLLGCLKKIPIIKNFLDYIYNRWDKIKNFQVK